MWGKSEAALKTFKDFDIIVFYKNPVYIELIKN